MRVTSDDVLDFKMRRLFVNVTLKPDGTLLLFLSHSLPLLSLFPLPPTYTFYLVLMPAAVEVDPAMLVIDATRMIVGKFQLSKKRKSGQEEYWNEYQHIWLYFYLFVLILISNDDIDSCEIWNVFIREGEIRVWCLVGRNDANRRF